MNSKGLLKEIEELICILPNDKSINKCNKYISERNFEALYYEVSKWLEIVRKDLQDNEGSSKYINIDLEQMFTLYDDVKTYYDLNNIDNIIEEEDDTEYD